MKSSSSKKWLKEHFSDKHVKLAKQEGFRARSVYKLIDIDKRHKLIKSNMTVVDLGAAPGGWSEYVAQKLNGSGKIFALDILPMKPIKDVMCIQGDFTKDEVVEDLYQKLDGQMIDLVLSDMAPNFSGVKLTDQMRSIALLEQALNFAMKVLKKDGSFLMKAFNGAEFEDFLKDLRKKFVEVKIIKPEASRARSSEIFLLARRLKVL